MRTPNYSTSQKIGNLGERVFVGGHPDTWTTEGVPRQGGDFGFDQSMWFEELGHIVGRFSVQLKAGANPKFTSWDEPTVAVDLSPEVCNLFLQDGNPVLLVFVALESENSSANAAMYYLWIEEELHVRLKEREAFDHTDPGSMRFHIPLANKLTRQTDITQHLTDYWNHTRIANRLRGPQGTAALSVVSSLSPRGITALTGINPSMLERRLINESMAEGSLWSTPKAGTTVGTIKQLAEHITQGNTTEADRLIGELQALNLSDLDEKAGFSFQQGRRQFLDGEPGAAAPYFAMAAAIKPDSASFFAAELEATVASHLGKTVPPELLARAERFTNDPEVMFQMARIAALNGDYTEAEGLLERLSGANKRKAQTLYHAIRHDWQNVIASADVGKAEALTARDQRLLEVLRARAFLSIVIGEQDEIRVGGRPDLDISDAVALREATMAALRNAQESGWPANSELLLDCAAATTVIFGGSPELLNLIADFARKRPRLVDAQLVLARIATFMDEPEAAVSALQRIGKLDTQDSARLVLVLSESGKHGDAVRLALERLIDQEHTLLVDMAVAMAAISAYRLGSTIEETLLRTYACDGDPAAKSLLRFISESIKHPEELSRNIDVLWSDAVHGGGNETLQDNLFIYLRPDREEDVDRLIELAGLTLRRRNLTQMESAKFSAALLRSDRFEEVVEFTGRAQELFPDDENIGLTRAVALDRLGQSSAAEFSLRRFENSSRQDLLNARSQLLVRIGEVEAAISLVQRALSTAKEHDHKFSNQRILATLYSRVDPSRYLDAVWRLGELANQEIESEEGAFLVHFVMATSGTAAEQPPERTSEFQVRVQRFSERFPDSKIFRVGKLSEAAPAEDILLELRELSGMSEAQARAEHRARVFGERSGSHVPFSVRPRRFAPFASNVVDLFRITTNAWHKGEASRVIVGEPAQAPSEFSAPPIIDLATLFALVELDLFDSMFAIWTAVAIPQVSLGQLAELLFEPLHIGNTDLVDKVADAIRRHGASIVQPNAPPGSSLDFPSSEFETISAEALNGRFDYLTFDLASAAMVNLRGNISGRVRTLWDLLCVAEEKKVLTRTESTMARLRVASWNSLGVPLQATDIAAASLGAASSDPPAGDDSPAARAVQQFLTAGEPQQALNRASQTLVELAGSHETGRRDGAEWFARLLYRESVLAQSIGFVGNADDLTARLAVLAVRDSYEKQNALSIMQFLWPILAQARLSYGGNQDQASFYQLIGAHAAQLFDRVVKKHGFDAIFVEAKLRELLFSLLNHGTYDREVLERAFYEHTLALQGR